MIQNSPIILWSYWCGCFLCSGVGPAEGLVSEASVELGLMLVIIESLEIVLSILPKLAAPELATLMLGLFINTTTLV